MKKLFASIISFALILVAGFSVGCSSTNVTGIPVSVTSTGQSVTKDGNTYTVTATEEALDAGIWIQIAADTAKGKDEYYTIKIESAGTEVESKTYTGRRVKLEDINGACTITATISIDSEHDADEKGNKYFTADSTIVTINVVQKAAE